ncbi:MAG: hypothetical protein QXP36_07830 [Conexivisphaerales archaeon]
MLNSIFKKEEPNDIERNNPTWWAGNELSLVGYLRTMDPTLLP